MVEVNTTLGTGLNTIIGSDMNTSIVMDVTSTDSYDYQGIDDASVIFTTILGSMAFLENAFVLVFMSKLLSKLTPNNEQYDFISQLLFVSIIDTLSALFVTGFGAIRVRSEGTALLCAIVGNLTATFQSMSLCNITCICILRYQVARNIRKRRAFRQPRFTIIMIIVDVGVFVLGTATFLGTFKLKIPDDTNVPCEYLSTVGPPARFIMGIIFYVSTLCFTVVSDTMCFLTIARLNREINVVVSDVTTMVEESTVNVNPQRPVRISVKQSQQRAIRTVILIIVFSNLSAVPLLLDFPLVFADINVPSQLSRIMFMCMFINSLVNPIIMFLRIQEIRKIIRQLWDGCRRKFV